MTSLSRQLADSYNEVAYVSDAQPQTHPDRLATLGHLHGLSPADVRTCRVLELGCGNGGNLLAAALTLPDATFVGIDVAEQAVREGQERVGTLGLDNVELQAADIMAVDATLGSFDYIIAHGVYSWVPASVRDRLLALCRELLADHGVAYVSYNVLPGWHLYRASREMMRYQMAQYEGRERQLQEARGLIAMLTDAQVQPTAYREVLERERERLEHYPDWFLVHDHVAEVNEPRYFHEFVDHAAQHDLRFLAEADFHSMQPHGLAPWVGGVLEQADDVEMREQYLDFFRGRSFRRTLLCRAERHLQHAVKPVAVRDLRISSPVSRVDAEDGETTYAGHEGRKLKTEHPFAASVLRVLAETWPRRVPFAEVEERVEPGAEQKATLEQFVFDLYRDGFADLHVFMPTLATDVSARPAASPLARLQVRDDTLVTNLLHRSVPVEGALERHVLALLDGTRTIGDVTRALPRGERRDSGKVRQALRSFARWGLLRQ